MNTIYVKGGNLVETNDVCMIMKQKKSKRSLLGKRKYLILVKSKRGVETSYKVKRRSYHVIDKLLPSFTKSGKRVWIKTHENDLNVKIEELTQTILNMKNDLFVSFVDLLNQNSQLSLQSLKTLETPPTKKGKRGKRQRRAAKQAKQITAAKQKVNVH